MVVSSNMFISLSRSQGQSQARSEVNSSIRFATELLRQDIKNASVISTPASGGTSSSLTLTRGGVVIVYDVSAGVLRRKEGAAAPVNLTNPNITVSTPTFTSIENTNLTFSTKTITLKINIAFSYNSNSPYWTYSTSLQTSVDLF